jgi:hypothetical protein
MQWNGEKHFHEARTEVDHIHRVCFEGGKIEEFTTPLLEPGGGAGNAACKCGLAANVERRRAARVWNAE